MLKSNLILNNVSRLLFHQNPHIFKFSSGIHYDIIPPPPTHTHEGKILLMFDSFFFKCRYFKRLFFLMETYKYLVLFCFPCTDLSNVQM